MKSIPQIRKKVEDVLHEHDLFMAPIDIEKLAEKLNIQIQHKRLEDDVSGFLLIKQPNAIVMLNEMHHKNRQRFTLAHEIGHYILHKNLDSLFIEKGLTYFRSKNYPIENYEIEKEANCFAAELLMPKKIISKLILEKSLDISHESDFSSLAKKLEVSERALAIRLMGLNYLDH